MSFVKGIWVGAEGVEAGLRAEIDRPAAIFEAREIGWIGIAKLSPAEGHEARVFLLFGRNRAHIFIALP